MTQNIQWSVSLSNGETLQEDKGAYKIIQNEDSPYRRLLSYLKEKDLKITSLSLVCGERRWILPSAGANPKFKIFCDAPKPIKYRFFRKMGMDINSTTQSKQEIYAVIEADYSDKKLQIWVSELNPENSWSLII